MSIEYVKCKGCKKIHREGRLSHEWIPGTMKLKGYCPTCGDDTFDEVHDVCECEKDVRLKNDDVCKACQAAISDDIADRILENIEPDRCEISSLGYRRTA